MKFKHIIFFILILILLFINTYTFAANSNEPELYCTSAILIDSSSGRVLYSKNENEIKYPASTTKILTAILAIENLDLNKTITASKSAVYSIPSGYSNAAIQVGEELTVYELLQVFLVHSANEAGYILAEDISGSIDEFAVLMNSKATEIGCKNTNFTNPSGLHDEKHYTTASDLALIAKYCMENPTFRQIVSMTSCTIPATNKSEERYYPNTNEILLKNSKYYNENVIGIKTGYTSQARNCLISAYSENDIELISVVLDAPQSTNANTSAKFTDTLNLFKYGSENFKVKTVREKNAVITSVKIDNATNDTKNLDLLLENNIKTIISNSTDIENLSYEINLNDNLYAPISQNQVLGTITYTIDNISYTENLIASHEVELSVFWENFFKLVIACFLLIIVYKLMYSKKILKKKKTTYGRIKY